MQELLLFGQVAAADQPTVQQQLSAITRMPPQPVVEEHLIFKPKRPSLSALGTAVEGGSSQQQQRQQQQQIAGDHDGNDGGGTKRQQGLQRTRQMLNAPLNYVHLVRISPGRKEEKGGDVAGMENTGVETGGEEEAREQQQRHWSLEFRDIPETGQPSVTSRALSKTRIINGDVMRFMQDLGYEYSSSHLLSGAKFYDQDTTLFLYRVLPQQSPQPPPPPSSPPSNSLPLDPSNSHLLQASIEIADGQNNELKTRATAQLLAFKEMFKSSGGGGGGGVGGGGVGVVLAPAERLALDTRLMGAGRVGVGVGDGVGMGIGGGR